MFYPMFAMVLIMVLVAGYLLAARVQAVRKRQVSIGYFRLQSGAGEPPAHLTAAARHYSNLFEVPLLFLITCLVAIQMGLQGPTMIALAWVFVITRVIHALIHLSYNNVLHRLFAFFAGVICVLLMWLLMATTVV
jgi:hypothetical protein